MLKLRREVWGYVSAKDGNDFDEGSTCITQVQGLRACRNAGIPVPKEIIERAKDYIEKCMTPDGGIQYSLKSGGGSRPPITAAALAAMNNAGEYESEMTMKMFKYCKDNVWPAGGNSHSLHGHWHYTHLYYSQVMYRQGEDEYKKYYSDISEDIPPQAVSRRKLEGRACRSRLHDRIECHDSVDG